MSLLFSEPVCILVDVFFNFGDVLAFALATFYTIQGDVTFKNVYPIAVLFTAIAFVSTLTTAFVSIRECWAVLSVCWVCVCACGWWVGAGFRGCVPTHTCFFLPSPAGLFMRIMAQKKDHAAE